MAVPFSSSDIFSVYSKIFTKLFTEKLTEQNLKNGFQKDLFILPSDKKWKEKMYCDLLNIQKKINLALESGIPLQYNTITKGNKPIFDTTDVFDQFQIPTCLTECKTTDNEEICKFDRLIEYIDINILENWTMENISKAGKLLKRPPLVVRFEDEHEMRKVYSLIYDVFRYKVVLSNALNDVCFYAHYPEFKCNQNLVRLMLFELFARHFHSRNPEEIELQNELYKASNIMDCLWRHRVQLAASISRMRIRSGALCLSQLLPMHLQNEKVAFAAINPIVTGWINPFRLGCKEEADELLKEMGLTEVQNEFSEKKLLQLNQYQWDRVCPLFLSCWPTSRSEFAKSDLVKESIFIMQDRVFALAPAILSRVLDYFKLDGDILQTHVVSPRSTAYLASLFHSTNRANCINAYGASSNLNEYLQYMESIGVTNMHIYAESFTSSFSEFNRLGNIAGILATPPNSFSAITDPIDLVCSLGGDLSMLEILTEPEISTDGKNRVAHILEEQRNTLLLAMSRPQIQFILYQTHSIIGSENLDMVEKTIYEINRSAFKKHLSAYKEKTKIGAVNIASLSHGSTIKRSNIKGDGTTDDDNHIEGDYSKIIKLPKTDQFELTTIPDIYLTQKNCLEKSATSCFLALMKRKQITRLDAKYLIKMAESRGLFGNDDCNMKNIKQSSKILKKQEIKTESLKKSAGRKQLIRTKKNDLDKLIKRLAQPTHASFIRSTLPKISEIESKYLVLNNIMERTCLKQAKYNKDVSALKQTALTDGRAKRWWQAAFHYVQTIQTSFGRKEHSHKGQNLLKWNKNNCSPVNLDSRERKVVPKEPYPVSVNYLHFEPLEIDLSSNVTNDISCLTWNEKQDNIK